MHGQCPAVAASQTRASSPVSRHANRAGSPKVWTECAVCAHGKEYFRALQKNPGFHGPSVLEKTNAQTQAPNQLAGALVDLRVVYRPRLPEWRRDPAEGPSRSASELCSYRCRLGQAEQTPLRAKCSAKSL